MGGTSPFAGRWLVLWAHSRGGQKTLQSSLILIKSDIYPAFNSVVQSVIIKNERRERKNNNNNKGKKEGLYNEQEQILNNNKQ